MISYQTENFGKRYEYRSNTHHGYIMPPHIHEFSEIAYTIEGNTTVIVSGKKYLLPKNHLIFIAPNQIHEYTDETDSFMRCSVFSNDHISAFFEKTKGFLPSCPIIDLSNDAFLLNELETVNPADTLKICGILNLLYARLEKSCEFVPVNTDKQAMFYEVIQYVSKNFCEEITLKALAKKLGYHEKYLSSALHSLTGMNFRAFLSSYRINYAKELMHLKSSDTLRISDIAMQCGFSSINSFNRVFKEVTGITPSAYRQTI